MPVAESFNEDSPPLRFASTTRQKPTETGALATLPELAVKILDYVQDHGRVTTRDMVREAGASPNTLKTLLANLVKKGLLVRHGGGRSIWYGTP